MSFWKKDSEDVRILNPRKKFFKEFFVNQLDFLNVLTLIMIGIRLNKFLGDSEDVRILNPQKKHFFEYRRYGYQLIGNFKLKKTVLRKSSIIPDFRKI